MLYIFLLFFASEFWICAFTINYHQYIYIIALTFSTLHITHTYGSWGHDLKCIKNSSALFCDPLKNTL